MFWGASELRKRVRAKRRKDIKIELILPWDMFSLLVALILINTPPCKFDIHTKHKRSPNLSHHSCSFSKHKRNVHVSFVFLTPTECNHSGVNVHAGTYATGGNVSPRRSLTQPQAMNWLHSGTLNTWRCAECSQELHPQSDSVMTHRTVCSGPGLGFIGFTVISGKTSWRHTTMVSKPKGPHLHSPLVNREQWKPWKRSISLVWFHRHRSGQLAAFMADFRRFSASATVWSWPLPW